MISEAFFVNCHKNVDVSTSKRSSIRCHCQRRGTCRLPSVKYASVWKKA